MSANRLKLNSEKTELLDQSFAETKRLNFCLRPVLSLTNHRLRHRQLITYFFIFEFSEKSEVIFAH